MLDVGGRMAPTDTPPQSQIGRPITGGRDPFANGYLVWTLRDVETNIDAITSRQAGPIE